MSPYLSLVERRADQRPITVMFIGPDLAGVTNVFRRADEPIEVKHTNSVEEFLEILETRSFDCVMVDQRRHGSASDLNVVTLAASQKIPHLIVMAAADAGDSFRSIHGIHEVLEAPIAPQQIMKSIVAASEKLGDTDETQSPRVVSPKPAQNSPAASTTAPARPAQPANANSTQPENTTTASPIKQITSGFGISLDKAKDIDQQAWQKFLPLINFLYKKTAITVLSALFLTFLFYGIMIVFFMASSSWSLPFELSRGHEVVMRAERDIGQLKVRQNQVRQILDTAKANLANTARARRDAELVLSISAKTIDLEIQQQTTLAREAKAHIKRLKDVIVKFNRNNRQGAFVKNLSKAYKKRTITEKSYNSGTLAVLETLHRMATVSNELALKEIEHDRIANRLLFLNSLKSEMAGPEIRTIVASGSDFVGLAREVIEAKATIAQSKQAYETSLADVKQSTDSLNVITNNISFLKSTPIGRAIKQPVTVLFVPYGNADNYKKGSPLYSCFASIVFCSKVGTVGDTIQGETNAVHPLFGKPLRGVFVEANISNPDDIKEELLHVGRPPLFF